jgi:hypothetical protein
VDHILAPHFLLANRAKPVVALACRRQRKQIRAQTILGCGVGQFGAHVFHQIAIAELPSDLDGKRIMIRLILCEGQGPRGFGTRRYARTFQKSIPSCAIP